MIDLSVGQKVWRFGMSIEDYKIAAAALIESERRWLVNFRTKGSDPMSGGFFLCESTAERDEVANVLKESGYRVVWEEA
jgi:hypothetical protein